MKIKGLILAYSLILLFRLLPYYISNIPISIDAWPIVRDVTTLLGDPNLEITSEYLDGYNNFWPGVILLNLMTIRLIDGCSTILISILTPLINGMGLIILSTILYKINKDKTVRMFILIILAMIYPFSLFYAGVTKETLAQPIYLTLFLLLLNKTLRNIPLLTITAISLIITHHLSSLLILIVIGYMILLEFYRKRISRNLLLLLYTSGILVVVGYLHYVMLGINGMKLPSFRLDMILNIINFLIFYGFLLFIYSRNDRIDNPRRVSIKSIYLILVIGLLTYYSLTYGFTSTQPHYSITYFFLSIPYLYLVFLAGYGKEYLKLRDGHWIMAWLLGISALLSYSILSIDPFFNTLSYRLLNFALLPLVVTSGYAVALFHRKIALATVSLLVILSPSFMLWYDLYSNHNEYLGYNWVIAEEFLPPGKWINEYGWNGVISGDTNVKIYFNIYPKIRFYPAYNIVKNSEYVDSLLLIYQEMYIYGYNHGSMSYEKLDLNKVVLSFDRIYDTIQVQLYWCRK